MNVSHWNLYRTHGLFNGLHPDEIIENWMNYACENFKKTRRDFLFFEQLFHFARFDGPELRKAIQLCRSSQFVARLLPHRRAFIRAEFEKYEQKQSEEQEVRRHHREVMRYERQHRR